MLGLLTSIIYGDGTADARNRGSASTDGESTLLQCALNAAAAAASSTAADEASTAPAHDDEVPDESALQLLRRSDRERNNTVLQRAANANSLTLQNVRSPAVTAAVVGQ